MAGRLTFDRDLLAADFELVGAELGLSVGAELGEIIDVAGFALVGLKRLGEEDN